MAVRFEAALQVTSRTLSLSELSKLLGREAQSGSHDKDSPRPKGLNWSVSIWRVYAKDHTMDCYAQCLELLNDVSDKWTDLAASSADMSISLDIAVYFEEAYCSLAFSAAFLRDVATRGIAVEITAYPSAP